MILHIWVTCLHPLKTSTSKVIVYGISARIPIFISNHDLIGMSYMIMLYQGFKYLMHFATNDILCRVSMSLGAILYSGKFRLVPVTHGHIANRKIDNHNIKVET